MEIRKAMPWSCVIGLCGLIGTAGSGWCGESAASKPVDVKFYAIITDFDEKHPMGSDIDTDDVINAMSEKGINEVAALLGKEGSVKLMMRGESRGKFPGNTRYFSGMEEPFISSFTKSTDKGAAKTVTQSTVTSGATVELKYSKEGENGTDPTIDLNLDFDWAVPMEKEGVQLIGRIRLSWIESTTMEEDETIQVGRFVREINGELMETTFILVSELEEEGEEPSK